MSGIIIKIRFSKIKLFFGCFKKKFCCASLKGPRAGGTTTERNTCMDYITLVGGEQPVNKKFSIKDGKIHKSSTPSISLGDALTVHVACAEHFLDILKYVEGNSNMVLILGFIPGAPERFKIVTTSKMRKLTKEAERSERVEGPFEKDGVVFYSRVKKNFKHSTWVLFDYDYEDGDPFKLGSVTEWRTKMCEISNVFENIQVVSALSSGSRVAHQGKPLSSVPRRHFYAQVKDPDDVERFGKTLFLHAIDQDMSWDRKISGGGKRRQTIFDVTTFSPERLVYVAAPTLEHPSLNLLDPGYKIHPGKALDTHKLANIDKIVDGVSFKNGSVGPYLLDRDSLKPETEIETQEHGVMSMREYATSGLGKIRCQSPFRASESWAAYVNIHKDGEPFLFDSGSLIKYLTFIPEIVFSEAEKAPEKKSEKVTQRKEPTPQELKRLDSLLKDVRHNYNGALDKARKIREFLSYTLGYDSILQTQYQSELASSLGWTKQELRKQVRNVRVSMSYKNIDLPPHRLPVDDWPDCNEDGRPLATLINTEHLMERLGIAGTYNVISKECDFDVPWARLSESNQEDSMRCEITSVCEINNLKSDLICRHVLDLARRNTHNPVVEWIGHEGLDDESLLEQLLSTLVIRKGHEELSRKLLKRWLISAIKMAYQETPDPCHGVLVQRETGGGERKMAALAL